MNDIVRWFSVPTSLDERYSILAAIFDPSILATSGITGVGERNDTSAPNIRDWAWEIRFQSSQKAEAFAKMIREMGYISVASPIVPGDAGESRCLLNPKELLGFGESLKLSAALKEKLVLTDSQVRHIVITVHPDLGEAQPDPTLNIRIAVNDLGNPKTPDEEKVVQVAPKIAELMGAKDPDNFWDQYEPNRYVYPPSRLYRELELAVPAYMQTLEERGASESAPASPKGLGELRSGGGQIERA